MKWEDSLEKVKGVGPKRRIALEQAGIKTVGELVSYYPRKYIDRSVFDNVMLPLEMTGHPPRDGARRVAAALERDFTGEMDDFLRGLLPMQNDYKPLSEPAAPSNGLRKKP